MKRLFGIWKILLVLIIATLYLFFISEQKAVNAGCIKRYCYYGCSAQSGNCFEDCICLDGDDWINCGAGQYTCNDGSGGAKCCDIGTGSPAGSSKPKNYHYGPDCPSGYIVDRTQLQRQYCTGQGQPPEWQPWWSPHDDRYVYGNRQEAGSCCASKETGGGNCHWDPCPTRNKPNKICKKCDPVHVVCTANWTYLYGCRPVVPPAPPVVVSNTLQNNGNALGCTASPGYAGKAANNTVKMTVSTPTSYSGGTVTDIRAWFGGTILSTETFKTDGTPQALIANGNFGVVVTKVGSTWTDIYAPSKYLTITGAPGASLQSWVKIGTVAAGGVIRGMDSKPEVSISNVAVTASGANTILTFDASFYNDQSGLQIYETAVSKAYQLSGAAKYTNTTGLTQWVPSTSTFTLDLISPTSENLAMSLVNETTIDVNWKFSDTNGLLRTIGNTKIAREGDVNGPIDRTSPAPATLNYVLGSVAEDNNVYNSTGNLWLVDGTVLNRTERINLRTNQGGALEMYLYAFDKACNYTRSSLTISLGDPWLITKAGAVYSAAGSSMQIADLQSASATEKISNDSYWGLPFAMYKADADITTEVVSSGSETLNDLVKSATLKSVRVTNVSDTNNKDGYWYNKLVTKSKKEITDAPANYIEVTLAGATVTLPAKSTSITDGSKTCANTKNCVVHISGDLTVNSNFSCDARTLFLVGGTVTINPDVTANNRSNGCIFVSKGDVNITKGTYKSSGSTYPKYDLLDAFIITDGIITIESEDTATSPRDGVKINGSLLAFGRGGNRSIELLRKLTLVDSNAYPSAAIHFDYRYLNFAVPFFGSAEEVFKQEVGYKPL